MNNHFINLSFNNCGSASCLPWNRNDPGRVTLIGTDLVVTGWGQITKDDRITEENFEDIRPSAKILKKGIVPHIPYRQCSTPQLNEYFKGENVTGINSVEVDVNLEICAGGETGTGCQGDAGGPLVYRDSPKGSWYQVGIVDWGVPCTGKPRPGIYTRVSAYLPWIESHLEQ
jgi:secreted trypsin-like serine protease